MKVDFLHSCYSHTYEDLLAYFAAKIAPEHFSRSFGEHLAQVLYDYIGLGLERNTSDSIGFEFGEDYQFYIDAYRDKCAEEGYSADELAGIEAELDIWKTVYNQFRGSSVDHPYYF
jgi:hypothetical protein